MRHKAFKINASAGNAAAQVSAKYITRQCTQPALLRVKRHASMRATTSSDKRHASMRATTSGGVTDEHAQYRVLRSRDCDDVTVLLVVSYAWMRAIVCGGVTLRCVLSNVAGSRLDACDSVFLEIDHVFRLLVATSCLRSADRVT